MQRMVSHQCPRRLKIQTHQVTHGKDATFAMCAAHSTFFTTLTCEPQDMVSTHLARDGGKWKPLGPRPHSFFFPNSSSARKRSTIGGCE